MHLPNPAIVFRHGVEGKEEEQEEKTHSEPLLKEMHFSLLAYWMFGFFPPISLLNYLSASQTALPALSIRLSGTGVAIVLVSAILLLNSLLHVPSVAVLELLVGFQRLPSLLPLLGRGRLAVHDGTQHVWRREAAGHPQMGGRLSVWMMIALWCSGPISPAF